MPWCYSKIPRSADGGGRSKYSNSFCAPRILTEAVCDICKTAPPAVCRDTFSGISDHAFIQQLITNHDLMNAAFLFLAEVKA